MKTQILLAAGAAALSLSLPATAFAATNLVTNGSFETGDFTGWTQFGNGADSGVAFDWIDGTTPVDGDHQAYFGPAGSNGGIRQSIGTTVGKTYHVSFFLLQQAGAGMMDFKAGLGGSPQIAFTDGSSPGKPYSLHEFTVAGTGAPMILEFSFRDDPAFFLLDDVVVTEGGATAIPEPGTWALMILGFMAAGAMLRRSRRAIA